MTTPNPPPSSPPDRRRRRRRRSVAELVLTASTALSLLVALIWFGGVTDAARVATHLVLAVGLLACVVMPAEFVRSGGQAVRVTSAVLVLALAACTGLLPIPAFLRGLVAPGWSARGEYHVLSSLDPGATLSGVGDLLLAAGTVFVVATWSGRSRARSYGWYAVYGLAGCAMLLAAITVLQNTRVWMGTRIHTQLPFFAPFVNPNHFGSLMVMVFPFLAGRALSRRPGEIPTWIGALMACACVGMVVWTGSSGPLLAMLVIFALLLRHERGLPLWVLALGGIGALGAMTVYDMARSAGDRVSLHGRIPTWWATVRMWADHWLFGTGVGTYEEALRPYRRDTTFESWNHAHNDWLEWLAETGLVGLAAGGVAIVLLWPHPRRRGAGGRYALLAVLGVGLHAVLDFPFHIPALLMLAGAALAWRSALYDVQRHVPMVLFRGMAAALALLQVGSAVWDLRNRVVSEALDVVHESPRGTIQHSEALATLKRYAPSTPEIALERALEQGRTGQRDEAAATLREMAERHKHRASVQAVAARGMAAVGRAEEAIAFADRAVTLGPSDHRVWTIRAEVYQQVAPERAHEAWKDVLLEGSMKGLKPAWEALPVGVYWADALQNAPLKNQLALARFLVLRDPEAAILVYDNVYRRNPDLFDVQYARLLIDTDVGAARDYLDRAVQAHPTDREFRAEQARILERLELWDEAWEAWEALAQDDPDARYHAALCLERAKGAEAALLELERARARGELFNDATFLLKASMHASLRQTAACAATIQGSGMLDKKRTRKKAQGAMDACKAEKPQD